MSPQQMAIESIRTTQALILPGSSMLWSTALLWEASQLCSTSLEHHPCHVRQAGIRSLTSHGWHREVKMNMSWARDLVLVLSAPTTELLEVAAHSAQTVGSLPPFSPHSHTKVTSHVQKELPNSSLAHRTYWQVWAHYLFTYFAVTNLRGNNLVWLTV